MYFVDLNSSEDSVLVNLDNVTYIEYPCKEVEAARVHFVGGDHYDASFASDSLIRRLIKVLEAKSRLELSGQDMTSR